MTPLEYVPADAFTRQFSNIYKEDDMEPQFFMVWNPRGRAPIYRHDSFTSAHTEAARLARANKGQEFYVLAAGLKMQVNDLQVTYLEGSKIHPEGIPF